MNDMNSILSFRVFPIALAALIATIFATDLHAGASNKNGNPFGNGTFFSNTATFSAVVRGNNLSGTVYFSTGADTNFNAGSQGSTVIVYEGETYNGNAAGMWSPSSSVISGQIWGGQTLSGQGSNTIYPEIYNTNLRTNVTYSTNQNTGAVQTNTNVGPYFPYGVSYSSNVLGSNVTYYTNGVISNSVVTNTTFTNTIYLEPIGKNVFNDSLYVSGNFYGNVQNSYPNQTFNANGTLSQTKLSQQLAGSSVTNTEGTTPIAMLTNNISVSVQGVRVSDNVTTFATVTNSVPYSQTTYTVTNISVLR